MADDWVDVPAAGAAPAHAADGWVDVPKAGEAPAAGPSPPISGPNGWSEAAKPYVNSTPIGGIMKAFGQGFREASGPDKLGLSPENKKWLDGIGKGKWYEEAFKGFNEGVILPTAVDLDGAMRMFMGTYRGLQAAGVEAGREASGGALERGMAALKLGSPEQLARDVVSIPDALAGSPGALGEVAIRPGLPKDIREGIAAERAPAVDAAAAETEPPPVNKMAETISEAKDLGVIGPERPPITEGTPKEVAERVTSANADQPPGEKVTQELPGDKPNPWRERFDSFVGKIKTDGDAKQLLRDAADQNEEFLPARQGQIPLRQMMDLGDASGIDPAAINRDGIGRLLQNDNQVRNAMQAMLTATEHVKDAAREVKADASPENLMKMQEALLRRDTWVEQVVGHRAEWGRTGNVFQEFLQKVKDEKSFNEFLKDKDLSPEKLKDLAGAIGDMDGAKAAKLLSNMNKPGAWDKFMYYWINSLISGPVTHTKYIIANAAYAAYEGVAVSTVAGAVGAVRRGIYGGTEGVYMGEAAARTYGLIAGVPDALKAAVAAAKTGMQTPLPGELAQSIIPKNNKNVFFQQRPIPGNLGAAIGLPSKGASAIHSFFNFLGYRASIEAQAYRQVAREGLKPGPSGPPPVAAGMIRFYHGTAYENASGFSGKTSVTPHYDYAKNYHGGSDHVLFTDMSKDEAIRRGLYDEINNYPRNGPIDDGAAVLKPLEPTSTGDSFWQRRQAIVDNPTVDMMNSAIEEGYRATFISELGPAGKAMSNFVKATKVGQIIMPFTHIPLVILERAMEGGPLAFLDPETRATLAGKDYVYKDAFGNEKTKPFTEVKRDTAAARLIVGGAVGAWAVNQVLNDRMTGSGPTDPKEQAQWKETGHKPYSIRIGDEWISFNRFGPLGTMLGLYSNLAEVIPHMKADSEELTKAIAMTIHSTGKLLEDEVGMQGFAGLLDAIEHPTTKGVRWVSNMTGSLLPFSSLQRQVASSMDPYMRETKSVVDGLRYYIPMIREGLQPKRNWLGEPIANAGYGGDLPIPGLSSIIQHGDARPDPLALEMQALDLHPAKPLDRIGDVKLTPKLYDTFQATAGALTRAQLETYINQPGWHNIPLPNRQDIFRDAIAGSRETARTVMQMKYPEIILQGLAQTKARADGVKPPKMKDPSLIMNGPQKALGIRG